MVDILPFQEVDTRVDPSCCASPLVVGTDGNAIANRDHDTFDAMVDITFLLDIDLHPYIVVAT
jgi:hypothetical protein